MIKETYLSPQAEDLLLEGDDAICQVSLGNDDIFGSDPVDWDWDNA